MYHGIDLNPPDELELHRRSGRSRHPSGSRFYLVEMTPGAREKRSNEDIPRGDPRYAIGTK